MKVLLITPYINLNVVDTTLERDDFYPSAASLHLAAVLRANNHEPVILDLNNAIVHSKRKGYLEYCKKIIIENLEKHKPDLVGINCLFSGIFSDLLKFAETIKSHSPKLKIATGGIHPTSFYKEILSNCNDIDYVSIGEGEKTLVSLANSIENNNQENLDDVLDKIKSFAFRDKSGKVKFNLERDFIDDLDSLPMPAWDLIDIDQYAMNLSNYYNPKKLPLKYKAAIFSSRACPLACNFCDMFLVMGKKHRKRSVKTIVNEMEYLNKELGINYFSFMDDQLTLNRGHVFQLCDEITNRGLNIQFDTPNGIWINSIREDLIAKMVETGLVKINLPIEHGDDYMRNTVIGKNLAREKIYEVAELCKKYNLMTSGYFLMGFPEDTNETLQNNYDMMMELQLDNMNMFTIIPFPETALFKQAVKDNLLIGKWNLDELWKTPISHTQEDFLIQPYNMNIDDLRKWRKKFDNIKYKFSTTNPKENIYQDKTWVST
mgnify:FL=1|tara:strand:- start:212 stop:1678 length:1467 start_codon:yes stop_codon:yes gene_type:complete